MLAYGIGGMRGLTFELRWDQRCGARPAKWMICLAASRAWCHAVGPRLERVVRRRCVQCANHVFEPQPSRHCFSASPKHAAATACNSVWLLKMIRDDVSYALVCVNTMKPPSDLRSACHFTSPKIVFRLLFPKFQQFCRLVVVLAHTSPLFR